MNVALFVAAKAGKWKDNVKRASSD